MKKIYILVNVIAFIWMSGGGVVWAQQTWSGTITDENGLPLPGATVIVENTNRGVVSDFDGNFSIQANQGEIIVISYIGYQSQRLTIGGNFDTNIVLQPGNELEEVVVTSAFDTQRRKELYGEIGVEWYDAKRLRKGITRTGNHRILLNLIPDDKRFFLKIPQNEIDTNENIDASVNANR